MLELPRLREALLTIPHKIWVAWLNILMMGEVQISLHIMSQSFWSEAALLREHTAKPDCKMSSLLIEVQAGWNVFWSQISKYRIALRTICFLSIPAFLQAAILKILNRFCAEHPFYKWRLCIQEATCFVNPFVSYKIHLSPSMGIQTSTLGLRDQTPFLLLTGSSKQNIWFKEKWSAFLNNSFFLSYQVLDVFKIKKKLS